MENIAEKAACGMDETATFFGKTVTELLAKFAGAASLAAYYRTLPNFSVFLHDSDCFYVSKLPPVTLLLERSSCYGVCPESDPSG